MPVAVCPAVQVGGICRQEVPSSASCLLREDGCAAQYHGTELGHGQLFITERDIVWRREDEMGFTLQYKQLIAHAVSKDTSVYPVPCIYMLYETSTPPGQTHSSGEEEEDEEGGTNVEIRIAPPTENSIPRLFEAISDGQLLHPEDENDSEEEEEGGDDGVMGGLAMSTQIRFDSDGQLLLDNEEVDERRYEDMEED